MVSFNTLLPVVIYPLFQGQFLNSLTSYFVHILYERKRDWINQISQDHRMAEVGRDLCRSSAPTSLLRQGHPEPVAQDHLQTFKYIQERRLHNLSGQPVPLLGHPHSEKVFHDVQTEPLQEE